MTTLIVLIIVLLSVASTPLTLKKLIDQSNRRNMIKNRKYIDVFKQEEGVRAFFTTKNGAVQGTANGTLYDNEEVFQELGLNDAFKVWPRQVHGTHIEIIREEDVQRLKEQQSIEAEQPEVEETLPEDTETHVEDTPRNGVILPATDGVLTDARNVLLTSVHADCLPVYLYDEKHGVIGLVHAGWRGAVAGIVPQAIRRMINVLGAGRDDIRVYIGPGISKCCFEVGSEVAEQFLLEWGSSFAEPVEAPKQNKRADALELPDPEEEPEQKYMLDLKAAVKHQVMNMGIPEENIEISRHCTCCEPEQFCSYRREGQTYMRMGAGICLI